MTPQTSDIQPNTERIAAKVIDGEAVIIDLTSGTYYSLTDVGGRIWELVDAGCRVEQIVDAIARDYDIPRDRASADVQALIQRLLDEQIVRPVTTAGSARSGSEAPAAPVGVAYRTPELQIYRDMQDLLALDPPMPGLEDIPWK